MVIGLSLVIISGNIKKFAIEERSTAQKGFGLPGFFKKNGSLK